MTENKNNLRALTGGAAVAEAWRQIDPEVVCAYPITPQTPIIETFAQLVAAGRVSSEVILAESEHSALSAIVGASAAGVRALTATSSQGLAYMAEILWVAAGLRLPIVMAVAARALSAPINIHGDHSDVMGFRDAGWIQLFCETAQEAYDLSLLAVRLAEDKKVLLPTMVIQDGFFTSHNVEPVKIYDDAAVRQILGERQAEYGLLNFEKPVSYGPLALPNYFFEIKYQQQQAMAQVPAALETVAGEFKNLLGQKYAWCEEYQMEDAEYALVVMGSAAGTAKDAVDELRAQGQPVGMVKIRLYRPFQYLALAQILQNCAGVAVLDRAMAPGAQAPLVSDVRLALSSLKSAPLVSSYIYGLGGRDLYPEEIKNVFADLKHTPRGQAREQNQTEKYLGLRD